MPPGRQPELSAYVQVAALGNDSRPVFVFPDKGDNDSLIKIGDPSRVSSCDNAHHHRVLEYINKYCYKGASAGRVCIKCNRDLDKSRFSSTQWGKKAGKSKCISCVKHIHPDAPDPIKKNKKMTKKRKVRARE